MSTATRPGSVALEVLARERGRCLFCAHKNVVISVWTGQADVAAALAAQRAAQTMTRRHPHGRSHVGIVLDGLPGPTPEALPLIKRAMAQRTELSCTAYVLEGSGFWASGIRSMISNTHRESGAAARLKIGTTPQEIATWLSARHEQTTGVAITPSELCEALSSARKLALA